MRLSDYNVARLLIATVVLGLGAAGGLGAGCDTHEAVGVVQFTSPQSNPIVLDAANNRLYVANTTSNTVDVIDTTSASVIASVEVGLEPSGLAVHPTADEVWVTNHLSDSVSVIDTDPVSETLHKVVQTVQSLSAAGVTSFDEPVGVAFKGDGSEAYVALSSTNDIAVISTSTYAVTSTVHITAQEPRALAVSGNNLYVAAFESFNQSELSICPGGGGGPQCTLDLDDLVDFVISSPNIPGADSRIVIDPDTPDRDVFVIDISGVPAIDHSVESVGTLLYGIAATSAGDVYVTQTHARNEENGGDNGNGQNNLIELDNRMFLNQIAHLDCSGASCSFSAGSDIIELEPLPPSQPALADALATPFGIAVSDDGSTLVATAAGTSRLFTVDVVTSSIAIVDLDAGVPADAGQQIPKGVALRSNAGAPDTAYVLNTLENTVSVVDVSTPSAPVHVQKIPVGADPTPDAVRRGRIAFNNAFASSTGTFSCESCHPDSNTDQLLWRIGGACFFGACNGEDEIRSTMPIRGLTDTLPLHWDGTLGDPTGGINGAVGTGGSAPADCALGDPDGEHDCFLDLVAASLSGVMCEQQGGCSNGPSGDPGPLSTTERDDMASFLPTVFYPPGRDRPTDDQISQSARDGFTDFWVNVGGLGVFVGVVTCGDMNSGCHNLPLGAIDDSTTLGGFDAPTMRGIYDRTLQFSLGITNAEEVHEFAIPGGTFAIPGIPFPLTFPPSPLPFDEADGYEEEVTLTTAFSVFQPVYNGDPIDTFQMTEEMGNGFSGAIGRQVTLNTDTTVAGPALTASEAIMDDLELADTNGQVNLRAVGVRDNGQGSLVAVTLSYRSGDSTYKSANGNLSFSHAQMISGAQAGTLNLTLTGAVPKNYGNANFPMPLLSVTTLGDGSGPENPDLPNLTAGAGSPTMNLVGIRVRSDATVYVDGVADSGASIACVAGGSFTPFCDSEEVDITLTSAPASDGLYLLQVQNPKGPMSPEFPFCVGFLTACRN